MLGIGSTATVSCKQQLMSIAEGIYYFPGSFFYICQKILLILKASSFKSAESCICFFILSCIHLQLLLSSLLFQLIQLAVSSQSCSLRLGLGLLSFVFYLLTYLPTLASILAEMKIENSAAEPVQCVDQI